MSKERELTDWEHVQLQILQNQGAIMLALDFILMGYKENMAREMNRSSLQLATDRTGGLYKTMSDES